MANRSYQPVGAAVFDQTGWHDGKRTRRQNANFAVKHGCLSSCILWTIAALFVLVMVVNWSWVFDHVALVIR